LPNTVFLPGEKIDLCILDNDTDLSRYVKWINDQKITKYMETGLSPVTNNNLRDYIESSNNSTGLLLGIFIKDCAEHIGNVKLHNINFKSRRADIGIMIGEFSAQGKGYGLEAIQLVLQHAFMVLNLNKICAGANINNLSSVKLFEKAGFQLEGTLREQFYVDDRYHDCLLLGILKREFFQA